MESTSERWLRCVIVESRWVALSIWQGLREWSGDAAYERFRRRITARDATQAEIPSAEQFYLDSVHRRFSRPNRCC